MRTYTIRSVTKAFFGGQKYIPVNSHESEPLSSSVTSLDSIEKQRTSSAISRFRIGALSRVICGILPALVVYLLFTTETLTVDRSPLIKTPIPEMPKEVRYFEYNMTFIEAPTPENDKAWNDLLPLGRGFVFIENGAHYGFEPGVETEYGEIYSISMYHQIHCLGLVRRNYWRLMNGIVTKDENIIDEANQQLLEQHTGHCFDYFRQSFECAADMAVEWPRTDPDGSRHAVDGIGIPHVCTSKQAVQNYMNTHQYNQSDNLDIAD